MFGCADIKNCSFDRIKLERHPGNTLSEKKVNSIGKKYFTIPEEFIDYYPILPDDLENEAQPIVYSSNDKSMTVGDIEKNAKRKRRHKGAKQGDKKHKIIADAENQTKNKVGRPPKATPVIGRFPSILQFFNIEKRAPETTTVEEKTAIEEIIEF